MRQQWIMMAATALVGLGLIAQEPAERRPGSSAKAADGESAQATVEVSVGEGGEVQTFQLMPGGEVRSFQMGPAGNMLNRLAANRFDEQLAQLLERLAAQGEMPPTMAPLATELRLVNLRLRAVERQLREHEEELLETPPMAPLLQAYREALQAYRQALAGNEHIRQARQRLAEIERSGDEMAAAMQGRGGNPREAFQKMREMMDEQRRLEEQMTVAMREDKGIVNLAQTKGDAAAAVMRQYDETLAADARAVALKAEQMQLAEVRRELLDALRRVAGELGLMHVPGARRPVGQQGPQGRRPGTPDAAPPAPPDGPVGLDAF